MTKIQKLSIIVINKNLKGGLHMKIGFIVRRNGETRTFFNKNEEKKHIDLAKRVIREMGLEEEYKKSKWACNDNPVDYLVYAQGGIKLGTRWEERVIVYSLEDIQNQMYSVIKEYIARGYRVEKVSQPRFSTIAYFHMM